MGKLTPQQIAAQPNKYEKKVTPLDKLQSTFEDSMKFNYENAWDDSNFTLGKVQQIMKDFNVDAIAARNLLLHEMNFGTQATGKLTKAEEIYTPETKKLYAEWINKGEVDLKNSPVQKAYEEYKKKIKTETGIDVLFDTKYDKEGRLVVTRPLTPKKEKQGWFGDAVDFVFGGFYDNKDELYDQKLTKEAVWRADWKKGDFNPEDIDSIYDYAQKNPKFKESLEIERAKLHNIHIKDINALWEKDIDEGLDQITAKALAKGMDDLFIFRPLVKNILGKDYVGLKDITSADQIEILNDKDGIYGQIDKIFKSSTGFLSANKDENGKDKEASMWEKGYKFGISQLPMTMAMMVGSTIVGKAVKGLGTLAMMDVANMNSFQKTIKPVANFLTKGNNLNPVKLMLNYEEGAFGTTAGMTLGKKASQWGLKGVAAFEKSVIGLGPQTGIDKLVNPEKREKDPNITWWQEGLRDLVDAGIEGVTEELVLFDNMKLAGRGKISSIVNLLMAPAKNAVGENIEEAISGIVNDAFDLWYKGKWGNQSIVSQIARNDYSQIYTTIGTSISAILMGGAFGLETKRRELQFYKNFGFNAKDIIEKWVNIKDVGNQILKNMNDSLTPQQRIALTQSMDEGKVLFAAYETGKNAKLTPEEQEYLDLKYGNDDFTKNLVSGMALIGNESNKLNEIFSEEVIEQISSQIKQSMVDNNLEIAEVVDKFLAANNGLNLSSEKQAEVKQLIIENAIFNTKFDYSIEQTKELFKNVFKDDPEVLNGKLNDLAKFLISIDSSAALKTVASFDAKIKKLDNEIKALQEATKALEAQNEEDNSAMIELNYDKIDALDIQKAGYEGYKRDVENSIKEKSLSVYKDPLMAFVGFRKEFLDNVVENMTPQEIYDKAKDILKISHPFSKNGRNAKAYLQGIVKEIERKAESGIAIEQSEKDVYRKSIEALATIYSYEDEKYGEKNLESLLKNSKDKNVMNMVNWFSDNRHDLSAYTNQTIINHLATYYESKGEKLTNKQFSDFKNKFNSLLSTKDTEELTKYLEEIMPDYVNKAQFKEIIVDMLDIWKKIAQKDATQKAKDAKKSTAEMSANLLEKGFISQKILELKDTFEVINGESYLKVVYTEGKKKTDVTYYIKIEPLNFNDQQKSRLVSLRNWQNDKGVEYNKFKNAFIDRLEKNIPFDIKEFDEYVQKVGIDLAIKDMYSLLIAFNFIFPETNQVPVKSYTKNTDGTLKETPKAKLKNYRSIYSALVNFGNKTKEQINDVHSQGMTNNKLLEFFIQPILHKYNLLGQGANQKVVWGNIYEYFKIGETRKTKLEEFKAFLNAQSIKKASKAPKNPVVAQTPVEGTQTPSQENKAVETVSATQRLQKPTSMKELDYTEVDGINEKVQGVEKNGIIEVWGLAVNPRPQLSNANRLRDLFTNYFSSEYVTDYEVLAPAIIENNKIVKKGVIKYIFEDGKTNEVEKALAEYYGENVESIKSQITENTTKKRKVAEEINFGQPQKEKDLLEKKDSQSVYKVNIFENTEEGELVLDKANLTTSALDNLPNQDFFNTVFEPLNLLPANNEPLTGITVVKPAKVRMENGKARVIEKGQVRYDNGREFIAPKEPALNPISLDKIEFDLEDGSMGLDKSQKKGFFIDPATKDIYWKEANPTGSDIENPRRFIYPFFEGEKGNDVIEKIEIVEPVIFKKNESGKYELAQKGKANFYYRDGSVSEAPKETPSVSPVEAQGDTNAEESTQSTPVEEIVAPEAPKKPKPKKRSLRKLYEDWTKTKDNFLGLVEKINSLTELPKHPEDLNAYISIILIARANNIEIINNLEDDLIPRSTIFEVVAKLYDSNFLLFDHINFLYSIDIISHKLNFKDNIQRKYWLDILDQEDYIPEKIIEGIKVDSIEKIIQTKNALSNAIEATDDLVLKNNLIDKYLELKAEIDIYHKHGLLLKLEFEPIEKVEIPEEEGFKLQTETEILSKEFAHRSDILTFLSTFNVNAIQANRLDELEDLRRFVVKFQQKYIKYQENDPKMIVLANDLRSKYFEQLFLFNVRNPELFVDVTVNYNGTEEVLTLLIPEENDLDAIKEELKDTVLIYDSLNTYNQIYSNEVVSNSIHEQIKLRYYYKNIEFETGSYYLTAINRRYKPDDYELSNEDFRKEFNSLVSLFRINTSYYLEDNLEKKLTFLTKLKDQIALVMNLELTEDDIRELKDLIFNTFDERSLSFTAKEYYDLLQVGLENLNKKIQPSENVIALFEETGLEQVSIKHAGLSELSEMFGGPFILDGLYNNETGEISVLASRPSQGKILHEALHHVFKTKNLFGTLDEVTKLTQEKITKLIEKFQKLVADEITMQDLSDVLDNMGFDFFENTFFDKEQLKGWIDHLTYAIKSDTEIFANFYSDTVPLAVFMSMMKAETSGETTDTLFDRYLEKILSGYGVDNKQLKDTLANLYNEKVNEQFKNFGSRIITAEPPEEKLNFDDDDLRNTFYEGSKLLETSNELMAISSKTKGLSLIDDSVDVIEGSRYSHRSQQVFPEIIDLNESSKYENVFLNTYDEEDINLDSYTMTKFLDDFMLILGDNFTSATAYEYFHDIPLKRFMEMVEEPSEELKEQDPPRYQAQKRIANYFNFLLEVSYDDRPNEDEKVFDNDNDKKRRRIIDLFNKLTSPNKHSIFEIIITKDETGEEGYAIRFMGNKSRTMDGKLVTQFKPPMMITEEAFLKNFIDLFNNFGVVKIGTRNKPLIDNIKVSFLIAALGKSVGESKDQMFAQPLNKFNQEEQKLTPQFRSQALAITKQLWNENFNSIFLNKFGDKNHFPAFSLVFNKEAKTELAKNDKGEVYSAENQITAMTYLYNNVILPIYKTYREMGINDIMEKIGVSRELAEEAFFTDEELEAKSANGKVFLNQPVITSLVIRALAEEFKLKNPVSSFQLVEENGTFKAKINTMLKGRNMIELMKRATPVLEHRRSHIINEMVLGDTEQNIKPLKSTVKIDETFVNDYGIASEDNKKSEMIWNGKELFFQVAFFSSKQVPPELKKYFFNKYGQFAFDGASFVVRDRFDSDYAKLMGVPNEGSAKNVILPLNAFIKHAVHAIHKSDPIGKWMIENNISMLIFDESEKNKVLLKEGQTLLRDSLTGEIPLDAEGNPLGIELGFRINEISEDFLSGDSKMRPATHFLSFNDIGRIGEKYSNKTYAKSLQQLFNSSGMTFINKALHIGDQERTRNFLSIVNEYSKTFADEVNNLFRNIDQDGNIINPESEEFNKELSSLFVKHLVNVAKNATGDLTKAFGKIFNEIVVAYNKKDENDQRVYSDTQLFDYMQSYMVFPLVAEVARDFMNGKMQAAVKMEDKGKQLVITPDMGNISQKRLSDALKSQIEFLEYQSDQNFSFKLFIQKVYFKYKREGNIPSSSIIFKEAKKEYLKFKEDIKNGKDVSGKAQYESDMEKINKQAKANLDKALDENGFLKRDYCFITKDTAIKLGIYVGDKVIGTIIPSAGLMEGKGLIVAGIIEESTMSPGTIVVNREYAQGIGRDYDIDVFNITVRNKQRLTTPKWNELVDNLAEIEKKYVKEAYKLFEKYLNKDLEDQIIKEVNEKFGDEEYYSKLSELDKKMLVAFDNRVFTEFQKKFLGENKTGKPYYSVGENWNFELADKYHKDVGYVIVMRTIHQYLSSIGLSFDLKIKIGTGKGSMHTFKVDFTDQDNWFENHISHMILTQHQVDYPKNTSKDEYDFSGEAIVTKMLGITVPYQHLNDSAKEKIRQIYKVFQNIISPLRIPDYTQSTDFKTQRVNTKFEDSMNKLEAYQTLKKDIVNGISQVDSVSNIKLSLENEKFNPYNTFVGELDFSNLKDVQNNFMSFDPATLHNYTKAIEYSILMDFISDTSNGTGYYLTNEVSRDLFEKNIKGVSQYLFTIKSYNNNNLEFGFNQKFYMDLRLRGRADFSLIAPEQGKPRDKNRTNTNFRFIAPSLLDNDNSNIDKVRIFDHTVPNILQPEGHLSKLSKEEIYAKNYEYYTHSMILEGLTEHLGGSVNHTKHGLLRTKFMEWQQNELEPYIATNDVVDFKKMDSITKEKWIRAFLLEHYGVSQSVWDIIESQRKTGNKVIPEVIYDKIKGNFDKYKAKIQSRKATNIKNEPAFYNAETAHLHFLKEVTGIYADSTLPPQIHYYLFEEKISQSDLVVPSILTGIMKSVMGTFSGDNEEYQASAAGFISNKEKFRDVVTIIAFSQLIVVGKRDHLVVEMGDDVIVNLQQVFSETLAKLKLDYIIDEQYSKIAFHMLSNPAIKWRKSVKNIILKSDDMVLEISHKGKYADSAGNNTFKLTQNGKLVEELINDLPINSKIYGILNNSKTWSSESNRKEIITAFDLFDEENYDLEDRLKLFSQLMSELLINMNLGRINENGVFVISEQGQITLDTAFKWMVGFVENTGTLSNSMYMPGVVIDNRILLTLMAEWSKKTLSEYKNKMSKITNGITDDSEVSRVFEEIQYKDIEIDLRSKPKRVTEQERVQEKRLNAYRRSSYEGSRYSGIKRLDKNLEKSKETILNLAKDVDVLRTSHILGLGDYVKNITSVFENTEDIEQLIDRNELENLVKKRIESFDDDTPIQQAVMQQIYTDLQVMKRDYSTIKNFNTEAIKYLMDFSYEDSRLDFDIFSNPLRFNRRIAFRAISFDKFNFHATEELETLKKNMHHPRLTQEEKDTLTVKEQRARLEEIKKENKLLYEKAKAKEQQQTEHEFYFIDPTEAYIRSRGTLPFNRNFTGLRPFSLMDLNYAKMSALSGQLASSTKELQDVINAISKLKDISFFNGISIQDQQKFEAEVYKQAEKLGDDNEFTLLFDKITGLFRIYYGDNRFYQKDQTNFDWLLNFVKYYTKQNSISKEQLLAIYGAIHLRKLFDVDLKLYIERTFYYFNTMKKEFGNDPLFAPEINRLREKYSRLLSNFTKFSTNDKSEYEDQKITPKIYAASVVRNQFPLWRFLGRYNYLQRKLNDKKTSPEEIEELEKLFALPYEEIEQKIMMQLQEEIDDRTEGSIFYVPLFSNIADNRLPNHIPSLEMIKEHIIGSMFSMIESDIATCYYYQSKAYGLRNATPANEMRVLDRWFEGISNPLYLKNKVIEVSKLKKDDYVVFYTHKIDHQGEQYSALNSGKVSSLDQYSITLTNGNGDLTTYPLSDIFVVDTESSKVIQNSVYIQKNDRWAKEMENKVIDGTATITEKMLYHSLNGFSELFVSSQMLWWSVIRTRIVQKFGGQIENYATGDMTLKEFFEELSSSTKAKIAKEKSNTKKNNENLIKYSRALLAASTYGGNQALDISMSETSQMGKEILVLSTSYRGSMELLKRMRMESPEYKEYLKLVEETEKRIKKINTQIAQGYYKVTNAERSDQRPSINEARKEIRNLQLYLEIAKNKLDAELYELEEVDEEYANIFENALKESTNITQLYGFSNKEISKMIKSMFWKHFKSLGFNYVREPEVDLRNAAFEIGFSMAYDNGATFEEALANGYKYTAITQVIYEKYAKKIGTDDVFHRAQQLLGNYTHQKMMWFKYRLSEYQYQKLAWQLKSMFGYDQYVLDIDGNVTMAKSSSGKKNNVIQTKTGKQVKAKLGASSFSSMIKMLRVTTFLTYLSNHINGVNSLTSPFMAPFFMLLQSLLNLFDPDDESTISDFLWVLNLFLGLRYGVGVGVVSTLFVVPLAYSFGTSSTYFEGLEKAVGKTLTTRVVTVPRDFILGLRRLMGGEPIEASNYFFGAITGFKFKRPEQFPYDSPGLMIADMAIGTTIPLGNEVVQLMWDLEEYDRQAYLNKKRNANERRKDYQERKENPLNRPIRELFD